MPMNFVAEMDRFITAAGNGEWIDVFNDQRTETDHLVMHAIFVPTSGVADEMKTESWGHNSPDRLRPGCTKYNDGSVSYSRFGNDDGVEPIIIFREFNGVKPPYLDVSEEFKLFHNLYFDKKNDKYVKIRHDGTEFDVIHQNAKRISIRSVELKQYLAIREMSLLLLFDLRRKFSQPVSEYSIPQTRGTHRGPNFIYLYAVGDAMTHKDGSFVRVLGKSAVTGFAKEDSDFWPYNEPQDDETYMDFVVGLDDKGREISQPCEPYGDRYLTPVHFRPDVLNKYYDNPTKYSVEDGLLRCAGLWSVQIDNDSREFVSVFLGDIGRDIPKREHGYWRSFNIAPVGSMSETAFRRSFMAEFASPQRKDLLFKQELIIFNQAWRDKQGWDFFKPLSDGDQHCLTSLRIPATDEQNEFDTQVMYLTKLVVDSLNEAELSKHIPGAADIKGISKLEEFLKAKGVPDYQKSIEFLRDIQSLRSTGAAHRRGSNYEKAAKKLGLDERDPRSVYEDLLSRAIQMLASLKSI